MSFAGTLPIRPDADPRRCRRRVAADTDFSRRFPFIRLRGDQERSGIVVCIDECRDQKSSLKLPLVTHMFGETHYLMA